MTDAERTEKASAAARARSAVDDVTNPSADDKRSQDDGDDAREWVPVRCVIRPSSTPPLKGSDMQDGTTSIQESSALAARGKEEPGAREQGVRTEHPVDLSSPQLTVKEEGARAESARQRRETDAESPGVLDERHRDPLRPSVPMRPTPRSES
jgi:hypothetical protein